MSRHRPSKDMKKWAKRIGATPRRVTGAVTPKPAKEPIIKMTEPEIMEVVDFSKQIGETVGYLRGVEAGRMLPRTAGEQRARDQGPAAARILRDVFLEVKSALAKHAPQHSPHEGAAVLQEEVDELWDEVKADRGRQLSARKEAIQVAAMAVRYVLDLDPR